MVHGSLSLNHVDLVSKTKPKGDRFIRLNLYGLPHITNSARDIEFNIGLPWYISIETLASDFSPTVLSCAKIDIWAFGIMALELLLDIQLCNIWKAKQMLDVLAKLIHKKHNGSALKPLLTAVKIAKPDLNFQIENEWYSLIERCLSLSPSKRPSASDLMEESIFKEGTCEEEQIIGLANLDEVFMCNGRTSKLTPERFRRFAEYISETDEWLERPIRDRPIEEVYYLWKLVGSSVETILKRKGLTKVTSPIKSMPLVAVDEFDIFGNECTRKYITDLQLVPLSMANLEERINSLNPEVFFESLELKYSSTKAVALEEYSLPTVVKERDIEYQLSRMILFDRLINAYPFKRSWLWLESRKDIPPLYRGFVWAALLNVKSDVRLVYDSTDKETVTPTDRQMEVDIPRCHQYEELLSSPTAHAKFKRILKAWLVSHPHYVYWQGLDSLSAPFLYLNFNNEALAYASFTAFIPRYLHKFFQKDNAAIIQEYLAVFSHLITFHDPELSLHMQEIGFVPDLYAIPWFLTMFAHVFPLHKLFLLWDTLLLGDSSFPLCVGVAILLQLRDRLAHYGFNECILLFSDLPEVDIEKCVEDSVRLFCRTPKSVTFREHALCSEGEGTQGSFREERGGSFTVDAITLKNSDLAIGPVPLSELKTSICPRLSAEDLLDLSQRKIAEKLVSAIDIRSTEEYNKGAVPASVSIPYSLMTSEANGLTTSPSVEEKLRELEGRILVVMGNRKEQAFQFAGCLIKMGLHRVCVLHKGIDVLRRANTFVFPPIDW